MLYCNPIRDSIEVPHGYYNQHLTWHEKVRVLIGTCEPLDLLVNPDALPAASGTSRSGGSDNHASLVSDL